MTLTQAQLSEKIEQTRKNLTNPNVKLTKESILIASSELQDMYKRLLMSDLDTGISRQVETFMWNDCFKIPLAFFIKLDRVLFNWMVEGGVGFYLAFIQDIGIQFDVPFIKNSSRGLFCTAPETKPTWKTHPSKASVYYIIQNSMVHVGDLLRYRGSFLEALKMYEKSTSVSPSNGHPYNQMGLVQMSIDSNSIDSLLSGIYYYARAVSVSNPFIPALQNLEHLLGKVKNVMPYTKPEEFIHTFLLGIGNLEMICLNAATFSALLSCVLARRKLNYHQLFRITAISLWAWKRESDKAILGLESRHRENNALDIAAAVFNGVINGMSDEPDLGSSIYIPHLKLWVEWLRLNPNVLNNENFASKFDVTSFCLLINRMVPMENKSMDVANELGHVILAEEKKLLGFLPVTKAYEHLQTVLEESDPRTKPVRLARLIKGVEFLSQSRFELIEFNPLIREFRPVAKLTKVPSVIRPPLPASSRRNVALQSILNQLDSRGPLQNLQPQNPQSSGGLTANARIPTSLNVSPIFSAPVTPSLETIFATPDPPSTTISTASCGSDLTTTPPNGNGIDTTPDFSSLFTSIWTPLNSGGYESFLTPSAETSPNGGAANIENIWK